MGRVSNKHMCLLYLTLDLNLTLQDEMYMIMIRYHTFETDSVDNVNGQECCPSFNGLWMMIVDGWVDGWMGGWPWSSLPLCT